MLLFVGWAIMLPAVLLLPFLLYSGAKPLMHSDLFMVTAGVVAAVVAGQLLWRFAVPGFGGFWRRAKSTYRTEYAGDTEMDLLLYLRPFSVDNAQFALPRKHELKRDRRFLDRLDPKVSLEEVIAEAFASTHRIVAIGRPNELVQPIGARRIYSDRWQTEVDRLIDEAGIIVLCLGDSPGIAWELDAVLSKEKLKNTVIVMPPAPNRKIQRAWDDWQRQMEIHSITSRDLIPHARLVVFSQMNSPRFVCFEVESSSSSTQLESYFASLREVVSVMRLRSQDTYKDFDEDITLEFVDPKKKGGGFNPPDESFLPPSGTFEYPREYTGE